MDISPDSVSHKFVTKFSDVLFTKFGDLENSSPNLVINPSQNLTLNTLKLIPRHHIWPNSAHYLRSGYFNFDDHPGDHIDVHQQIWIELVWKGQSICSAIIEYGVHTTDTREQALGMEALLIVVVAFNLEALLIVVVSSKDLIQFSLKMSFSNYV